MYQCCENGGINGVTRDGGYAEYCTLRSEAAVRIPSDADPAAYAPLLCAGVTVFNGIRKMGIVAGDVVAVQGLGGLGHLAIQYSRKMGYRTVALSSGDQKREFAKELGATDYIDQSREDAAEKLKGMGGAGLIVVTAPNPEVISPLVSGLAAMGKLLVLARTYFVFCLTAGLWLMIGSCWGCAHKYGFTDYEGPLSTWLAKWSCAG